MKIEAFLDCVAIKMVFADVEIVDPKVAENCGEEEISKRDECVASS